jgi:hypothetical protein
VIAVWAGSSIFINDMRRDILMKAFFKLFAQTLEGIQRTCFIFQCLWLYLDVMAATAAICLVIMRKIKLRAKFILFDRAERWNETCP